MKEWQRVKCSQFMLQIGIWHKFAGAPIAPRILRDPAATSVECAGQMRHCTCAMDGETMNFGATLEEHVREPAKFSPNLGRNSEFYAA